MGLEWRCKMRRCNWMSLDHLCVSREIMSEKSLGWKEDNMTLRCHSWNKIPCKPSNGCVNHGGREVPHHPLHDQVCLYPIASATRMQINYLTILEVTSLKCVHRAAFLLEALEKNSYLAVSSFQRLLHSLTCGLLLAMASLWPLLLSSHLLLWLTLVPPSVRPLWWHWIHLDNLGYSPHFKILNPS